MLAYAELEEETPGTVNGITYTKDGDFLKKIIKYKFLFFFKFFKMCEQVNEVVEWRDRRLKRRRRHPIVRKTPRANRVTVY